MSDQPVIAFLGTGIMGQGMIRRLLGAGFPVRVWNRTAAKAAPLADDGATLAGTPVDAVTGADVVITMLSDADAVLAAMDDSGALAAMGAESVWLQMSTVGVDGCARVAEAAAKAGVPLLDAPVLGTRMPAEQGTLKILVAGPTELRPRCEPVLAPMGTIGSWQPEVGQASALKLAANSWVLAITAATATSIRLAQALGVDPQLLLDTVAGGLSDSRYLHVKGAAILSGDYTTSFAVTGAAKDTRLIVEAGRAAGFDPELIGLVNRQFERAAERGYGDDDMAAIYEGLPD